MSETIRNRTNQLKVFVLGHDQVCTQLGRCLCVPHPTRENELLPTSLILPAGYTGIQVEEEVLRHPGIARAVRQGDLEVTKRADEAPRRSPRRNAAEGVGGENQ
jgi:hypothetical protein